jgi:hypothetical protein
MEWQAVFGATPLSSGGNLMPGEPDNTSDFMPSSLLDINQQMSAMSLQQGLFCFPLMGYPLNFDILRLVIIIFLYISRKRKTLVTLITSYSYWPQ